MNRPVSGCPSPWLLDFDLECSNCFRFQVQKAACRRRRRSEPRRKLARLRQRFAKSHVLLQIRERNRLADQAEKDATKAAQPVGVHSCSVLLKSPAAEIASVSRRQRRAQREPRQLKRSWMR